METGVVVALVSGAAAVSIPGLTYWLTKRREHEAAWRDLKLKHYQEYMVALSGVVGGRTNIETRARYADAANALPLSRRRRSFVPSTTFRTRFRCEEKREITLVTTRS